MDPVPQRLFHFSAGEQGPWQIQSNTALAGTPLPDAPRLMITVDTADEHPTAAWRLQGITSNDRYVTREEKNNLIAHQPELGRPSAHCGALIALRKTPVWWGLTQDERREIVEHQSRHISTGMRYLPAIARRLYHCRDLGTNPPFDFITWFEYSDKDTFAFDELLALLRQSVEWEYVEREVDIRCVRRPELSALPSV
jgi:hypothetical protein